MRKLNERVGNASDRRKIITAQRKNGEYVSLFLFLKKIHFMDHKIAPDFEVFV